MNVIIFLVSWFVIFYFYGRNCELKAILKEKESEIDSLYSCCKKHEGAGVNENTKD